jgi:signal transduction histidine kinase
MPSLGTAVIRSSSSPLWLRQPQTVPERSFTFTNHAADASTVAIAVIAWYCALRWPANGYLVLLTALSANLWLRGRVRAVPLSIGAMTLAALATSAVDLARLVPVLKDPWHVVLFLATVGLMAATTSRLCAAQGNAERLALSLARLNVDLGEQVEEVQTLSEHLQVTNDALAGALLDAERVGAMAGALRTLTTELSQAIGVHDVAQVALSRGMRVMNSRRGCLVIAKNDSGIELVDTCGYSLADEEMLRTSTSTGEGPLVTAVREGTRVRSCTQIALPLLLENRVIGAIAFDLAQSPPTHTTSEPFTALLSRATADALARAQRYEAERSAREAAELTARAREEVMAVVAHDLRNPLNLLGSSVQLLMELSLPVQRREAINAIATRAVARMDRIIDDLLDAVRLESGHLSLEVKRCEVNHLLAETASALRGRAVERGIVLEVLEDSAPLYVSVDPERMMQLVDNLVGNALKFTPAGGRITVSASRAPNELRVTVADTGPGISEEHRAHMFDRFWQASGGDRRGIGLGLTIARGIAEAHGGRLSAESVVGEGSVFQFAMPFVG